MIIKVVGIENIDFTKNGDRVQSKKIHYARLDHGADNIIGGIVGTMNISPRSQFFNYPIELGGEYVAFTDEDPRFKDKRVLCHFAPAQT